MNKYFDSLDPSIQRTGLLGQMLSPQRQLGCRHRQTRWLFVYSSLLCLFPLNNLKTLTLGPISLLSSRSPLPSPPPPAAAVAATPASSSARNSFSSSTSWASTPRRSSPSTPPSTLRLSPRSSRSLTSSPPSASTLPTPAASSPCTPISSPPTPPPNSAPLLTSPGHRLLAPLLLSSVPGLLEPTLYFLQRLGFVGQHKITCHTTVLLVSSVEGTLICRLDYLQGWCFFYRETKKMVLRSPGLLTISIVNNFSQKVELLVGEMGKELSELKEFSQYFSFSLEG
ncbi:uncharacterized protein [Elaeis guineensis]|uniref:uncharacterized protein n=1 Tax=Elaeis guineensis var. tenera TaxID=51953 RepID=UPI003C6D4641